MIHNISIATDDDITHFGKDVNIYPVYFSRAIIIWINRLNWLEKTIVSDHIFCQILVSWFENSLMATECTCGEHPRKTPNTNMRRYMWRTTSSKSLLRLCIDEG